MKPRSHDDTEKRWLRVRARQWKQMTSDERREWLLAQFRWRCESSARELATGFQLGPNRS